ncbi:MAG: Signal peptidase I [uncultured Nocardioidaceae bacterium]|uniref:Signal peptidase I n=1 Tax=uncultured Nocardioidaceae bacterium TaxID=253824 RepID=A0A6J4M793_9ACTN|nr:MAG: Signal peptidase I [uncultured Nocardioidaceae bacterium]
MTTWSQTTPRRRAGRVAGAVLLAAAIALLVIAVLVPMAAGGKAYTVLTSSMSPALEPGSLAMVRPVDTENIGVGSVITYQLQSDKPEVVTHRVVTMGLREDGSPVFRTKGDANPTPDPEWVRPVQVIGSVWYAVPYVGRLNSLMTPQHRDQLIRAIAVSLMAYGLFELLVAARDRLARRTRQWDRRWGREVAR